MTELPYFQVTDWERFQHYKDRNPPWIKLATDTFQDYEFSRLQDASKLLAVCIWTLAARSKEVKIGRVPADLQWIKNQCGLGDFVTEKHLQELLTIGLIQPASNPLATCLQPASPETETETEGEGDPTTPAEEEEAPQLIPTALEEIREAWNALAAETGFRPCRSLGPKRKAALRERLRDPDWRQNWPAALEAMRGIGWMRGKNARGWIANFDFFLRPETLNRLLEGGYGDTAPPQLSCKDPDDSAGLF